MARPFVAWETYFVRRFCCRRKSLLCALLPAILMLRIVCFFDNVERPSMLAPRPLQEASSAEVSTAAARRVHVEPGEVKVVTPRRGAFAMGA
jgi:hypothetical protein